MNDDHISEEEFLLEFFGLYGREFGDPDQYFVDNPTLIIPFIKECEIAKNPAFISVQPRKEHYKILGIEKLFFDFDYADKTFVKKLEAKEKDSEKREKIYSKRVAELEIEVIKFVNTLINRRVPRLQPMIVKTRKGYHVYIYFDKVYSLDCPEPFLKQVYSTLTHMIKELYESHYGELKYLDSNVYKDVYRMARVPLSIHEKSGEQCVFMKLTGIQSGNPHLEKDKIRGLDYFRNSSLKEDDLLKAVKNTKIRLDRESTIRAEAKKELKDNWEITHGYTGNIRPCFQKALQNGEMHHQQRLALEIEAWYSGIHDFEKLVEVFRPLHDFDGDKLIGSISRYQVGWFLDHEIYLKNPPYTCETLQKYGWCIESEECPIFKRRKEHEQKSTP